MIKFIGLFLMGVCPLFLTSCQTSSTGDPSRRPNQLAVNTRVKQSSDKYSKLSSSQKKAVSQGKLTQGMKKEGVRLAWGKPDKVESTGGKKEQWTYYRTEQVLFDQQAPGRSGFSQYYRGSEKYYDGNSQSDFQSVRREDRTVHFENGRVASWTQSRY